MLNKILTYPTYYFRDFQRYIVARVQITSSFENQIYSQVAAYTAEAASLKDCLGSRYASIKFNWKK